MTADEHSSVRPASDADPWQVIIVKHGTRESTRSEAYLNYSFYSEPDGPHRLDYYFWVLRRGDDIVIIDTGFAATEAVRRGREILIDPLEALRLLDIDPAAGHPVVITHGHYDHSGNVAAFRRSPIYIATAEWEFWTDELSERILFSHFRDPLAISALAEAERESRLVLVDQSSPIAPGIDMTVVGGHTPGQAIVTVATSEGLVVLASDAVHFHEELERDMLFQSMTDLPCAYRALEWLRSSSAVCVVSGHDATELDRHTTLPGPLAGLAATIGS